MYIFYVFLYIVRLLVFIALLYFAILV